MALVQTVSCLTHMFCLVHGARSCVWHSFFSSTLLVIRSDRLIIFHSSKSVQSPLIEIKCGFGRLWQRVNVTAVGNMQLHLFSYSAAADGTPLYPPPNPPITLTSTSMSYTPTRSPACCPLLYAGWTVSWQPVTSAAGSAAVHHGAEHFNKAAFTPGLISASLRDQTWQVFLTLVRLARIGHVTIALSTQLHIHSVTCWSPNSMLSCIAHSTLSVIGWKCSSSGFMPSLKIVKA